MMSSNRYTAMDRQSFSGSVPAAPDPPGHVAVKFTGLNAAKPQLCESKTAGKEKQLFSPNIKGVVNDMAIEVGLNAEVSLPNAATKRGLMLADSSDDEDKIHAEKIGVSANETNSTAGGSESPVKKPKNAMEHI